MTEAQSLYVVLTANSTQYKRIIDDASRDMRRFGDDVDDAGAKMDRGGKEIDKFSGRLAILARAAVALGPAVIPAGAQAIVGLAGITNALGFTALAAGTTGIAFIGLGDALSAVNKAQLDPTAENLAEARKQLTDISPEAAKFVVHLNEMIPALQEVRNSAQDGLFPGLDEALSNMETALPRASAFFEKVAAAAGDAAVVVSEDLTSGRWDDFVGFLEAEARPTLLGLTDVLLDVTHGMTELWQAFAPSNTDFLVWLQDIGQEFDSWSAGLKDSDSLDGFFQYVKDTGPDLVQILSNVAEGFGEIIENGATISGPLLEALGLFSAALPFLATFTTGMWLAVTATTAATLAQKAWSLSQRLSIVNGPAAIGHLQALAASFGMVAAAATSTTGRMMAFRGAAATMGSAMRGLAKPAALLAGVGLVASGAAGGMGLANTATLALTGAMIGGAGGALAGGLVGAFLDAKAGSKGLREEVESLENVMSSSSASIVEKTTKLAQSFADYQARIKDTRDLDGVGDFFSDVLDPKNPDSIIGRMGGAQKATDQWRDSTVQAAQQISGQLIALDLIAKRSNGEHMAFWTSDAWSKGDYSRVVKENLGEIEKTIVGVTPALDELGLTWDEVAASIHAGTFDSAPIVAMVQHLDSSAGRIDAVGEALAGLDDGMLSTAASTQAFATALAGLLDPKVNVSEQTDEWIKAIRNLDDDLSGNSRTLKGNSAAALENRDAIRGRVTQLQDTLTAQAAAGASSDQLARSLEQQRSVLMRAGRAAGLSKTELAGYLRELGLTPRLVRTTLRAVGIDTATAKVKELRRGFRTLPNSVQIQVRSKGVPKTTAEVDKLVKNFGLTEKQRTALIRLKDQGAKKGTTDILKLLDRADKKKATPEVKVDATKAEATLDGIQARLNGLDDAYVNVYVTEHRKNVGGKTTKDADGGLHVGGVRRYADGGFGEDGRYYGRESQIVAGGANILWGEEETGWEAYISGKPSQRGRNRAIWADAGRRLGYEPTERHGSESVSAGRVRHTFEHRVTVVGELDTRRAVTQLRQEMGQVARGVNNDAERSKNQHGRMAWP